MNKDIRPSVFSGGLVYLISKRYDFGVWEYQNVEFFTELKFGENSLPYTSEITMLGNPVFCKPKGLSHDKLDEC